MIADTPEKIEAFRLLSLKGALKLESIGMKRRGQSALSIIKKEFNLTGTAKTVYPQFVNILQQKEILQ
jgi:hypothetical protein